MKRALAWVVTLALMPACSWINVRRLPSDYTPPATPDCTAESNAPAWDIGFAVVGALGALGSALYPASGQSGSSSSTGGVVGGLALTGVGVASAWYGLSAVNACKLAKDEALARARDAEEHFREAEAERVAALEAARATAAEKRSQEALARAAAEAAAWDRAREQRLAAEEAETAAQAERARPGWRSTEGYQKAMWGMSRAQVRRLFPRAEGDDAILSYDGTTAGLPARTSFYFTENRLVSVNVRFRPVGKTRSEREAFDALLATLTEKYGEPSGIASAELNGDPTATWSTEKTDLELQMNSLSIADRLVLIYSSKELEFLKAKLDDQAKDDL